MAIISEDELNRKMSGGVDPAQVPGRSGGSHGHMAENIREGTDAVSQERGAGRFGSDVHDASQVGGENFYGSGTIISLNEAPPLQDQHDPDVVVVPVVPPAPKPPPFVFPKAAAPVPVPAAPPKSASPATPPPPASIVALLGRMKPKG